MFRIIILFIFFIVPLVTLFSQSGSRPGTSISGIVTDSLTAEPMVAATVSVVNSETGTVITGALTDADGQFEITGIPAGTYDISVSYIGYQEEKLPSIELSEDMSVGTILLSPSDISLDEVMVVGEKAVIENRFDKIVYNVGSDVTSQGAVAIDVLRKVPSVSVDADGNVELQGNSNIRFLINGKTSSI